MTLAQCSNRCQDAHTVLGGTDTYYMRSFHRILQGAVHNIQIVWPNYIFGDENESVNSSTVTVEAAIEYPLGTRTRFLFGGANTLTTNAARLPTDLLSIELPDLAWYLLHLRIFGTAGFSGANNNYTRLFYTGDGDYTDWFEQTSTNYVMSGTPGGFNWAQYGQGILPINIVTDEAVPRKSVTLIGDSREEDYYGGGSGDFAGASGVVGLVARALDYHNLPTYKSALYGNKLVGWSASANAQRILSAACCTNTVIELGANSLYLYWESAANCLAELQSMRSLLGSTKPTFATTIYCEKSGSYLQADHSDQNPIDEYAYIREPQRAEFNSTLRANTLAGIQCLDVAAAVEVDGGLQTINGVPNIPTSYWYADGVHPSTFDGIHMTEWGATRAAPLIDLSPLVPSVIGYTVQDAAMRATGHSGLSLGAVLSGYFSRRAYSIGAASAPAPRISGASARPSGARGAVAAAVAQSSFAARRRSVAGSDAVSPVLAAASARQGTRGGHGAIGVGVSASASASIAGARAGGAGLIVTTADAGAQQRSPVGATTAAVTGSQYALSDASLRSAERRGAAGAAVALSDSSAVSGAARGADMPGVGLADAGKRAQAPTGAAASAPGLDGAAAVSCTVRGSDSMFLAIQLAARLDSGRTGAATSGVNVTSYSLTHSSARSGERGGAASAGVLVDDSSFCGCVSSAYASIVGVSDKAALSVGIVGRAALSVITDAYALTVAAARSAERRGECKIEVSTAYASATSTDRFGYVRLFPGVTQSWGRVIYYASNIAEVRYSIEE